MGRILQVSDDSGLLTTRELLLRAQGYEVTSALGTSEGINYCAARKFDLLIVGHSMRHEDKIALVKAFRAHHKETPILALHRHNEPTLEDADYEIPPDPEVVLSAVASLTAARRASGTGR
jgi:DNA-binding response OmpR family regulator